MNFLFSNILVFLKILKFPIINLQSILTKFFIKNGFSTGYNPAIFIFSSFILFIVSSINNLKLSTFLNTCFPPLFICNLNTLVKSSSIETIYSPSSK